MLIMAYKSLTTLILRRFLKATKNNHIYNNLLLVTQFILKKHVSFKSKNLTCEGEKKKKYKVYKFY